KGLSLHGVQLGINAPAVPVYVAALGPQMLRLAGEYADGVTPNWCSAKQIEWMRAYVAEGARRAGRAADEIPFALYIRVCIDEDEEAARRAFATQLLGYALARPGTPKDTGYRAHFARMGYDEILSELEARREAGTPTAELVDAVPRELLLEVGYFGHARGAVDALRRLSHNLLEEAIVRLITVRPGDLQACLAAVGACQPGGGPRPELAQVERGIFPEFYADMALPPARLQFPACNGPIAWRGPEWIQRDIARFQAALQQVSPTEEAFMPALSPGQVWLNFQNDHYPSDQAFVFAAAEALANE